MAGHLTISCQYQESAERLFQILRKLRVYLWILKVCFVPRESIDTGGWSVNCGALFNEASTKCSLVNNTTHYISSNSHLIMLHIDVIH